MWFIIIIITIIVIIIMIYILFFMVQGWDLKSWGLGLGS